MLFAFIIFTFLVRFFIFVSRSQYQIICEYVKYIPKSIIFAPPTYLSSLYFYPSAGMKKAF